MPAEKMIRVFRTIESPAVDSVQGPVRRARTVTVEVECHPNDVAASLDDLRRAFASVHEEVGREALLRGRAS